MLLDEALLRLLCVKEDLSKVQAHLEKGEQRNRITTCQEDVDLVVGLIGKILGTLGTASDSDENTRKTQMLKMIQEVEQDRNNRMAELSKQ